MKINCFLLFVWYRRKLEGRWGKRVRAVTVSVRGGAKTLGPQSPPPPHHPRWSGPLLYLPREMKQFYLLISEAPCARYDQRQGKLWRRLSVPLLHYINSHFLFIQDKSGYAYQPDKFHKYENYVKRTNLMGLVLVLIRKTQWDIYVTYYGMTHQ